MNAIEKKGRLREYECAMRQLQHELSMALLDKTEPLEGAAEQYNHDKVKAIRDKMVRAQAKYDDNPPDDDDSATKDSLVQRCICFVKDVLGVHGGGTGGNLAAKRTGVVAVLTAIGSFVAWLLELI